MNPIGIAGLERLTRAATPPCVSIYVPGTPIAEQARAERLLLRAALDDADEELQKLGIDKKTREEVLAPGRALAARHDREPLPGRGIVLFLWRGGSRSLETWTPPERLVVVGRRLHVRPLLERAVAPDRFVLVSIREGGVRLFGGDRDGLVPLPSDDVPQELREVVGFDHRATSLQMHSQGPGAGAGARSAVFHGQGAGVDDRADERTRYLRAVDRALAPAIRSMRCPVVLAAAEPVAATFRRLSGIPGLLATGIPQAAAPGAESALHARAWPLVRDQLGGATRALVGRVRQGLGTGRVIQQPDAVFQASIEGRVADLLCDSSGHLWADPGSPAHVHATREAGDLDLIDIAAVETLRHGGDVRFVEKGGMPTDDSPIAAVLRRP
ncbi:MAG: hypothetical protein O3C51_06505 [Planctomycetota bacterium]|nr:hypothetical protein [Planctomycetota bacterium]